MRTELAEEKDRLRLGMVITALNSSPVLAQPGKKDDRRVISKHFSSPTLRKGLAQHTGADTRFSQAAS